MTAGAQADWLETLQNAHRLFEAGDYLESAQNFELLANQGEQTDHPKTYRFYLQAGRAAVLGGEPYRGTNLALYGLKLLALDGATRRLETAGVDILAVLRERGLDREAQRVTTWLASGGLRAEPLDPHTQVSKVTLPEKCPTCGAAIQANDLEWVDETTAVCDFCASLVRGEPRLCTTPRVHTS